MSQRVSSLLARGVDPHITDSRATTPFSTSTCSSISEDSLLVPPELYIINVIVDINSVRGSGSYGSVYVASWHHSKVAAKKLHQIFFDHLVTAESKTGILRSFARETNMLIQLKHPNIVQFYGLYSSTPGYKLNSDTYLVQELMHCALDDRIRQTPKLTLRNILNLSLDVAGGLRYLHERQVPIIHRDLASKNILLSSTGVAKIADLGVAKIVDETRLTPQSRLPGTELYMPPEVKIEGMAYDTKVDIYSFGVIILEMAIGRDSKANEAFRVSPNNSIILTPEIERRKQDFEILGHHPLRAVILNCLSRRDDRPTARTVTEQLTIICASKVYLDCPVVPVIITASNDEISNLQILEEKVKTLEMEKELLQRKLGAQRRFSAEQHLDALMAENASLQSQISQLITEGPKSLPEQLSSNAPKTKLLDSEVSLSADQLHTLSELSLSKKSDASELKKLKKQLDKYKTVNVEMDKKLKEARLELQKYNGQNDMGFRQELDLLRSECRQLQGQLDFTNRERGYLQSQLSAALSHRY